jgi:hypothetical protein
MAHTRKRVHLFPSNYSLGGRGELFLSPQKSMKIQRNNTIRGIRKKRIPNKPRANCSLVFGSLKDYNAGKPFKDNNDAPVHFFKSDGDKKLFKRGKKAQSKALWNDTLESLKRRFPVQMASSLSKKQRRAFKNQMTPFEYNIFCSHTNTIKRGKRAARKAKKKDTKPRRLAYETFIHSPLWEDRKNKFYQQHSRRCAACDTYKHIHLHHMVYGQFGNEPDEHLVPLCETHHKEYHERFGTQRNMLRTTEMFISQIRSKKMLELAA